MSVPSDPRGVPEDGTVVDLAHRVHDGQTRMRGEEGRLLGRLGNRLVDGGLTVAGLRVPVAAPQPGGRHGPGWRICSPRRARRLRPEAPAHPADAWVPGAQAVRQVPAEPDQGAAAAAGRLGRHASRCESPGQLPRPRPARRVADPQPARRAPRCRRPRRWSTRAVRRQPTKLSGGPPADHHDGPAPSGGGPQSAQPLCPL